MRAGCEVQLAECWSTTVSRVQFPVPRKQSMVVYIVTPSAWEVEEEGSQTQGYLQLHGTIKANLGYETRWQRERGRWEKRGGRASTDKPSLNRW